MACLATAPGELVPTTTLATKTNVPSNYLAKVLQQLASAGLIRGRRGVGGGYMLAREAADINLLEIVQTVGELQNQDRISLSYGPPSDVGSLQDTLAQVKGMVMKSLEDVTLQSLVQNAPKPHQGRRAAEPAT